jgi:hypothetical protein
MAVDGTWSLTMQTPMGERKASVTLKSDGATLTGTQSAEAGTGEIFEGKVRGDTVGWKVSIQQPMPLTLDFNATVTGDAMDGTMGIGFMGSFPFTGVRA